MKKAMAIIMIASLICVSLCGCKENNRASSESEELLALEMKFYASEAALYVINSNKDMIYMFDALYIEDIEASVYCCNEALNLLVEADKKMKEVISSPSSIEEDMKKLQENYTRTIEIMNKFPNISGEEREEFHNLLAEGTYTHVYVEKCLYSFVMLYNIREFDSLPDDEAQEKLKESWVEFGFDTIECPDTIDEKELYLIWAKQYSDKELDQSTIDKIFELRENDNLTSKEYNKKWMELVQEICSTDNWDEESSQLFNFYYNIAPSNKIPRLSS